MTYDTLMQASVHIIERNRNSHISQQMFITSAICTDMNMKAPMLVLDCAVVNSQTQWLHHLIYAIFKAKPHHRPVFLPGFMTILAVCPKGDSSTCFMKIWTLFCLQKQTAYCKVIKLGGQTGPWPYCWNEYYLKYSLWHELC